MLMVNLLYKSFGYNKTIDSNVVTFYDEMFNALYKRDFFSENTLMPAMSLESMSLKELKIISYNGA